MNTVGTTVPELTAEHRDGTWWADANLALWAPIPDVWGGGWVVTMREPFTITQCHMAEATRAFGPYVAVLEPPTSEEDRDGGGLRDD
ncbi:hypothetical protein SEA_KNOCKER_69 [Mycobacterium phage Knocker]|nr:hypothetical protein SEA_KNOCKER_69 [Mycobacterium phage Knocker]